MDSSSLQDSGTVNRKFVSFLNKFNFRQLTSDQCVFVGNFANAEIYLAIYVVDCLVMSQSESAINELIKTEQQMFKITVNLDSNKLQFVGLEIEQDYNAGTFAIHQHLYIEKFLSKFNMNNATLLKIPAEPSAPLSINNNVRQLVL